MNAHGFVQKDLVLLGGGHSHIAVLRRFGMRPVPGVRLTLVTREIHTPYSGMLPGYIAGHYDYDQVHIDLRPLANFAHARVFHADIEGLDLAENRVLLAGRPPVAFDLLSVNTGAHPHRLNIPGVDRYALAVKPIDQFLLGWQRIVERVRAHRGEFRLAVVGGGAGGVELAFATHHRLQCELDEAGNRGVRLEVGLMSDSDEILSTYRPRVRGLLSAELRRRGIHICTGCKVLAVEPDRLLLADAPAERADAVLWVTHAAAPAWIAASGMAVDERGFVRINETLRSVSHPQVFAAGDIASMDAHPRPKSGVFAVRQGKPLAENLRRALDGQRLRRYRPQRLALSIISTGDKNAVAGRGRWHLQGRTVWRIKDWIDQRFVGRYNDLPAMPGVSLRTAPAGSDRETQAELSEIAMRCGGCGAKVGATVLSRVINRIQPITHKDVLIGLDAPDDAAVITVPAGLLLAQTVDYFRSFVDDPHVFGKIAANHSLGDIYAMGAEPQSALAIATVPYAREAVLEEQLFQLMSGAVAVLNEAGAALIGGHSSEGAELSFGLSVTGLVDPARLLRKGGMRPGQRLILTKPIGTGTLFAADMRRKAKGRWVAAAIDSMLVTSAAAAACLLRHGASACTDVTGFGLLGHLVEMLRASACDAELDLDAVPLLEGALETSQLGIFSSLQPQNIRLRRALQHETGTQEHPALPLLFDPQTAGGLLASVPAEQAEACATELQTLGYARTSIIGSVCERGDAAAMVRLRAGVFDNGHAG